MSAKEWQGLGQGWTPLILCMMWEAAKGNGSIWEGYLETMPIRFDTPMFWPITDLEELRGTSIADKIGREEAEKDYIERLVPLLKSRPDLFLPSHLDTYYTLEQFHIMGSRILSRSFHVEEDEEEKREPEEVNPDVSMESSRSMEVDRSREENPQTEVQEGEAENEYEEEEDSDSDSEDGEKVEDVAMVPMADMLNARYGGENAKLFYEPHVLKMVTTKAIAAGDQIWNTYGDPPNSDLLRRYGYVDEPGKGLDIVEIQGSLVVKCAASYLSLSSEQQKERVGWWLEMGGDDTFTLDMTTLLPPELLSFTQLLLLSDMEWEKTQEKEKPPKPKSDSVKKCVKNALERRMEMYSTTIEEDEHQLSIGQHTLNKRHALIIRIGEKKVLKAAIGSLSEPVPKKRKAEPENGARKKGARQK
ncbi:Rubisco LSMT substrate-binding, partial [Rhizoctonia solani]